ncbi:MAG: formate dehydrogenase subunit gamma [Burkholderiaceae bacterium]
MITLSWRASLAVAALVFAGQAVAQAVTPQQQESARQEVRENLAQPYNNAPVYREVRAGQSGFTQLGAPSERGVLIQSAGQTWKEARTPILLAGGLMVALAMVALGSFYSWRGPIKVGETGSKRMIKRFQPSDRYAHWFMAIVWVALAVTGLIISFGKSLLLPVIGFTAFSWVAAAAKNLHNFIGPFLIVAVPWMIVRYLRYNWVDKEDLIWMTKIIGNLTGHEYPSGKFNGGEKMVFWLVLVVLSTVLIVTGLVLDFPNFGQSRSTMQIVNLIHMLGAYVAMALACVHIYLGTVGMTGAYRAMRDGYVTAEWAQHHHERWYADVKAGKVPESPMVPEASVPEPVRQAVLLADK